MKAHRYRLVRDHVDTLGAYVEMAFLPPYAPDLNPVEYLWAWLKRHAPVDHCPNSTAELAHTTHRKFKSAQRRTTLIAAFWKQADLFRCHEIMGPSDTSVGSEAESGGERSNRRSLSRPGGRGGTVPWNPQETRMNQIM